MLNINVVIEHLETIHKENDSILHKDYMPSLNYNNQFNSLYKAYYFSNAQIEIIINLLKQMKKD